MSRKRLCQGCGKEVDPRNPLHTCPAVPPIGFAARSDSLRSALISLWGAIPETKPEGLDAFPVCPGTTDWLEALARDAMLFKKLLKEPGDSIQLTRTLDGRLRILVDDNAQHRTHRVDHDNDTIACIAACRAVHQQENKHDG